MRQKFGQNFLQDNNIANNIILAAKLNKNDFILEIGPGKGALTKLIVPKVAHLTAVEIDKNLSDNLISYFSKENIQNIAIIHQNFLKTPDDFLKTLSKNPLKIISNLPYNIGTAIIQKILPMPYWSEAYFMLQKEVAQRLAAKDGRKEFGYISLFRDYYADIQILFDISPRSFHPQPKVSSTLIKLVNKNPAPPPPLLFDLIKHCFNMRRKMMLNCLAGFNGIEKTRGIEILKAVSIDPDLRPDKIILNTWIELAKQFSLQL